MNDQERTEGLKKLREPFPPEAIGKLPRITCKDCSDRNKQCSKHSKSKCKECGAYISTAHIHLDFVGHAEATDRLLSTDPEWSWEPLAVNEVGLPVFDLDAQGRPVGLWIKLTVCGVTRRGYGSVEPHKADAVKELIGDAIRNAAMRFGVALDLWAKSELESALTTEGTAPLQPSVHESQVQTQTMNVAGAPGPSSPVVQSSPPGDDTPPQRSGGAGASIGAAPSPAGDDRAELLALINARFSSGDLEWAQVRGKAKVAAALNGETPPTSQAQLKNLSAETLRNVLARVGTR